MSCGHVFKYLFVLVREAHGRVVDDGLHLLEGDGARIHIECGVDDLAALAVFALVGGRHRRFDSVNHGLATDTAVFKFPEHYVDGLEIYHGLWIMYVARAL